MTMSVSKYMYNPDICDGHFCPGDCDLCSIWDGVADEEVEAELRNKAEEEYEQEMEEERRGYK